MLHLHRAANPRHFQNLGENTAPRQHYPPAKWGCPRCKLHPGHPVPLQAASTVCQLWKNYAWHIPTTLKRAHALRHRSKKTQQSIQMPLIFSCYRYQSARKRHVPIALRGRFQIQAHQPAMFLIHMRIIRLGKVVKTLPVACKNLSPVPGTYIMKTS